MKNKSVHVITCDNQQQNATAIPPHVHPGCSRSRMDRMNRCRNLYLEAVAEGKEPDYLVVLDIDVERFSLAGIAQSFGLDQPWDALFANGRWFSLCHRKGVYYDTYPFRLRGDASPRSLKLMMYYHNHEHYGCLRPGDPLVPVDSAFGGLGIYRYSAVTGLRYRTIENTDGDPRIEVLCDHESLHADMRTRGCKNLFIHPALEVTYQSLTHCLVEKWKQSMRKRLDPRQFRANLASDQKKWLRSIRKQQERLFKWFKPT